MIFAVVPVKTIETSKSRLASVLASRERVQLVRQLLHRMLHVLRQSDLIQQTMVITPDPVVMEWAIEGNAIPLPEKPVADVADRLNIALAQAAQEVVRLGATGLLVLPADLPFITLAEVEALLRASDSQRMIICPDRHLSGTNALILNPPQPFTFHYGLNSYQQHQQEASQRQLAVQSLFLPGLQFDLDTAADWRLYLQRAVEPVAP